MSTEKSLLKTLREKEKFFITSNFSYFHRAFYPFGELSAIFSKFKIVVFKLLNLEQFKICRLVKGQML